MKNFALQVKSRVRIEISALKISYFSAYFWVLGTFLIFLKVFLFKRVEDGFAEGMRKKTILERNLV
jgi:hypothetical protein